MASDGVKSVGGRRCLANRITPFTAVMLLQGIHELRRFRDNSLIKHFTKFDKLYCYRNTIHQNDLHLKDQMHLFR